VDEVFHGIKLIKRRVRGRRGQRAARRGGMHQRARERMIEEAARKASRLDSLHWSAGRKVLKSGDCAVNVCVSDRVGQRRLEGGCGGLANIQRIAGDSKEEVAPAERGEAVAYGFKVVDEGHGRCWVSEGAVRLVTAGLWLLRGAAVTGTGADRVSRRSG